MDRHRDRSVMDRGREFERRDEMSQYPRGRQDREGFPREPLPEGRAAWRGRDPEWERDRYDRGGGYGQGSAGGFNEQHTSEYRSDYAGEDRWRPGREFGDDREEIGSPRYSMGGDRGEWTSRRYGASSHSGANRSYGDDERGVGAREWRPQHERDPYERDRDWNQDTRERGGGAGVMESIGRFFGFGPKNYRRSDERIAEELNDRLYRHPDIDASDVDVTVKDGEVTLSGTVDSRRAKYLAEDLCDRVMGVEDVNNQLRVRKQETSYRPDRGMPLNTSGDLGEPSRPKSK